MSTLSTLIPRAMHALMRLIRLLFGRTTAFDAETGLALPVKVPVSVDAGPDKDAVPTLRSDIAGVPALILSTMAVGAAFRPQVPVAIKTVFPSALQIPIIVVTPAPREDTADISAMHPIIIDTSPPEDVPLTFEHKKEAEEVAPRRRVDNAEQLVSAEKASERTQRSALAQVTNVDKRVHGKMPSSSTRHVKGKLGKENIRHHPQASRLTPPSPSALATANLGGALTVSTSSLDLRELLGGASTLTTSSSSRSLHSLLTDHEKEKALECVKTVGPRAGPGSTEWEMEKTCKLEEARAWSKALKNKRRRSSPTAAFSMGSTSISSSTSILKRGAFALTARLSLEERLRRAVSSCMPPSGTQCHAPAKPLWGDDQVVFVLGDDEDDEDSAVTGSMLATSASFASASSSKASISSILDAFETEFGSERWTGLPCFENIDSDGKRDEASLGAGASSDLSWSDRFLLGDYL